MDFLKEFRSKFPVHKRKMFSPEERLKLLELDQVAEGKIRGLIFEKIDVDDSAYAVSTTEVVLVSKIVGINRQENVKDWVECLLNLHKRRNFELFRSKEEYVAFLINDASSCNDLPHLIERGGKYYVSGNGKHRVTFAKCLGIEEIFACVSRTE